jgi:hypothetical protein
LACWGGWRRDRRLLSESRKGPQDLDAERTAGLEKANEGLKASQIDLQRRWQYLAEAQRLSHSGTFVWKVHSGELVWSDETYKILGFARRCERSNGALSADTHFVVFMNAKDPKPSQELNSREALARFFADLNKYAATMHFLGQTTILTLANDRGTGETYCMPHHLTVDGNKRQLMIAALRWIEERILS